MKLPPEVQAKTQPLDVESLLHDLDAVWRNESALICCPAHDDRSPSLKITIEPKAPLGFLAHCFAGCSLPDIVAGLRLLADDWDAQADYREHRKPFYRSRFEDYTGELAESYEYSHGIRKIVGRLVSVDTGEVVKERAKMTVDPMGYGCAAPNEWYVPPGIITTVLPELRVVSSESDAEALWAAGYPAVSVPGGDQGPIPDPIWNGETSVVIVGDNDPSGQRWAKRAQARLGGTLASLPRGYGDAREALEAGDTEVGAWGQENAAPGPWTPVNLAAWIDNPPSPRERFGSGDIAYKGGLHWLAGEPQSGKSILAMWYALQDVRSGGRALLLDEEAGPVDYFGKLAALGATREDFGRIIYLPPSGRDLLTDRDLLYEFIKDNEVSYLSLDSYAIHSDLANSDEDKNKEVTRFVGQVLIPLVQQLKTTVVVLDHMVKPSTGSNNRYARGAGAKLALAEVGLFVSDPEPFSKDESGRIRIECTKNRFGDYTRGDGWMVHVKTGDGSIRFEFGPKLVASELKALEGRAKDPGTGTRNRDLARVEQVQEYLGKHPGASNKQIKQDLGISGTIWTRVQKLLEETS